LDVTLQARLARLRDIARAPVVDRHELNSRLRSLIETIVIDWEQGSADAPLEA
jgi:hypothetical protein